MAYTVGEVAEMSGVSVRTLHHYDREGLLKPSKRSGAGYRLYTDDDVEKLQQIMFFRELDLPLARIAEIMGDPGFDRAAALKEHRKVLVEKRRRLDAIIASLDATVKAAKRGGKMKKKEMFEPFNEETIERYRKEAREKYCGTTVDECERRTASYTMKDWNAVREEGDAIHGKVAGLMAANAAPEDPAVQECLAEHFKMINERFYTCTPEIYIGLGELYVDDPRFTAYFEKIAVGLAHFMRDAMRTFGEKLK